MNEAEFTSLLKRMEDETLDFKAESYRLSSDREKAHFIKDILSMANTPRETNSYIILGVKKRPNGTFELLGIDTYPDEADLQSLFSDRVQPIPQFSYEVFSYAQKDFGIIAVPPRRDGLFLPTKDYPRSTPEHPQDILRRGQIYFRRGSKNDYAASPEDIRRIASWMEGTVSEPHFSSYPTWEAFLEAAHHFEPIRRYLLFVPPLATKEIDHLDILGKLPWTMVVDFDPDTDITGLQSSIGPALEEYRSLHRVVLRDRPTLNTNTSTYWFYALGLKGRAETLSTGSWKDWQRQYGNEMNEQLNRLAAAISPVPVTCIILWYSKGLLAHLRSLLNSTLSAFQDEVNFVITTEHSAELQSIAAEYETEPLDIPLHHLCSGLQSFLRRTLPIDQENYELPSSSGAPIPVDAKTRQWMEEELEFVYLSVGLAPSPQRSNTSIGQEFLRGAEIDWYELNLHADVDRDKTTQLKHEIEASLERKRAVRINLYHDPGAGGTTVARRLLWDFHLDYPSAILHRCTPAETAERIYRLASLTKQGVLLLIDGAEIAESQVDELYNFLRSRQVPVVLLQTLRRFQQVSEKKRAIHLSSTLSPYETPRFVEAFSRQKPEKRQQLERLAKLRNDKTCTAFYFGLETFGKDFLGLEPYVRTRLADLATAQKKILVFLALAHHYAQLPIQAQAFADLLGFPKSRVLNLSSSLPSQTCELLVEVQPGVWRTAHDVFAQEILEQLLWPSPSGERRLWKQNLSSWGKEFASFCRGKSAIPSEDLEEIVSRTFIYRDNADLLGTELSAHPTFAQLIHDVPSREGRVELLRYVAELYPDKAHFWAHLGRLYAVEMKDFNQSLTYVERAISLQGNDHVLYHMKGMTLRYLADELIKQGAELEKVISEVKRASEAFEEARRLGPDDPYGYISEVQMLAHVLDYAGRQSGSLLSYWSSQKADIFLRNSLERAEELLERVRRNREGEGASTYEENCRARLDMLYGRHEQALQIWDNLLNRRDIHHPPLRRQIVWTYLARRGRSWDALEAREVERIVTLLEQNLQEESSSDSNLRLWVQAVRRLKQPPTIDAVIERVSYWKASSDTLDPVYYLYVFNVLQVLDGSVWACEDAKRFIDECRHRARLRRNRTKSLEWLGTGKGISQLVYHSELGKWLTDKDFWEKTARLTRVQGRIARIDAPQSGQIEIEGGLYAFFVPARGEYSAGRSENQSVDFYLGFSYDGLRAWEVRNV